MVSTEKVLEIVEEVLNGSNSVQIDLSDSKIAEIADSIVKSRVRLSLSSNGISVDINRDGTIVLTRIMAKAAAKVSPVSSSATKPQPRPQAKRHQHTYVQPRIAKDIIDAILDDASHVIWFKGPTGTGKTVLVDYIARELGYELFKINCNGGLGPEGFFGDKSIEIDEKTGQNHIVFKDGPVVKAMQTGLDEDGNEVGKPGLLFLDEAGSIPPHVSIALNHLLESDDPRRTITLNNDSGRVVRSHSKFRIILAANTAGRGATSIAEASYTAQMDALDISLLNRVALTFKFGYDRNVEKHIAMEKIGNDKVIQQVLNFRDSIRDNIRSERLSTPFSTRHIVKISDAFRIFGDIGKAIYYTTFEQLLPEEQPIYNEIAVAKLGVDILKDFAQDDIDYM